MDYNLEYHQCANSDMHKFYHKKQIMSYKSSSIEEKDYLIAESRRIKWEKGSYLHRKRASRAI